MVIIVSNYFWNVYISKGFMIIILNLIDINFICIISI